MENKNKILKNILSFVLIIAIALIIKMFVFSPVKVNGTSMSPTLNDGDIMLLNEIGYHLYGVERFDDEIVVENFKHEETADFSIYDIGHDTIPENCYFLVGDNRGNSKDSRTIGVVHKSKIMGKTRLIIFPFDRVSTVQ